MGRIIIQAYVLVFGCILIPTTHINFSLLFLSFFFDSSQSHLWFPQQSRLYQPAKCDNHNQTADFPTPNTCADLWVILPSYRPTVPPWQQLVFQCSVTNPWYKADWLELLQHSSPATMNKLVRETLGHSEGAFIVIALPSLVKVKI